MSAPFPTRPNRRPQRRSRRLGARSKRRAQHLGRRSARITKAASSPITTPTTARRSPKSPGPRTAAPSSSSAAAISKCFATIPIRPASRKASSRTSGSSRSPAARRAKSPKAASPPFRQKATASHISRRTRSGPSASKKTPSRRNSSTPRAKPVNCAGRPTAPASHSSPLARDHSFIARLQRSPPKPCSISTPASIAIPIPSGLPTASRSPSSASPPSTRAFSSAPSRDRATLVHSSRRRRFRKRPRTLARRRRPRQRLPRHGRRQSVVLGRRRSHRFPLGTHRLDAPLFHLHPRRRSHAAQRNRRIRNRARLALEPTAAPSCSPPTRTTSIAVISGASPFSARTSTPVTHGDGIEWSPIETSDGKAVAMLHSDARNPARAAIKTGNGERSRSRARFHSRRIPRSFARRPAAGHPLRRRRHAHPRPALSAARSAPPAKSIPP